MRIAIGVVLGMLLALGGAKPALASPASTAILDDFLGVETIYRTGFSNYELYYATGNPVTSPGGGTTPIDWAIGFDATGGSFAMLTDLGGTPSVVICPASICSGGAEALDDIIGADVTEFGTFLAAGGGLTVNGVGMITTISDPFASTTITSSTPSSTGDISSQLTYTLSGLPIVSITGGLPGALITSFGPAGTLRIIEDLDPDFAPGTGAAIPPLPTAPFDPTTGDFTDGAGENELDANSLTAGFDADESLFLSLDFVPTGSDGLSLINVFGPIASNTVTIGGVTYVLNGTSTFSNTGRPFLLAGGTGSTLYDPGTRFSVEGSLGFGGTSSAFGLADDPSTFTFVHPPGGAPEIRGGPVVPEPTTLWLLGMGLISGLGVIKRRKKLLS